MDRFSEMFVLALRPNGEGDIGIDAVFDFRTIPHGRLEAMTFRSRYNPDIRYLLAPMPYGSTVDKVCDAVMKLSEEERLALYKRGKGLK